MAPYCMCCQRRLEWVKEHYYAIKHSPQSRRSKCGCVMIVSFLKVLKWSSALSGLLWWCARDCFQFMLAGLLRALSSLLQRGHRWDLGNYSIWGFVLAFHGFKNDSLHCLYFNVYQMRLIGLSRLMKHEISRQGKCTTELAIKTTDIQTPEMYTSSAR